MRESITITNCPLQITSDPHIFKNIYNFFSNFRVSEPNSHKKLEFETIRPGPEVRVAECPQSSPTVIT